MSNDFDSQLTDSDIEKLEDILPEINEDIFLYNNLNLDLTNVSSLKEDIHDLSANIIEPNNEALYKDIHDIPANIIETNNEAFYKDSSYINDDVNENLANNDKTNDLQLQRGEYQPTFYQFIKKQFFSAYNSYQDNDANYIKKCQKVSSLFKIPFELEIFITYGLLQCTNSFLQLYTFLPIRFIIANFHLGSILIHFLHSFIYFGERKRFSRKKRIFYLKTAEVCDLLKGYLLLLSTLAFCVIDTSMVYHIVRGQAIIKLYLFFNMLEIADRLCTSLGQDILESLYWAATFDSNKIRSSDSKDSNGHLGLAIHFMLALIYLFIHAFLILLQATTLNVAFNSHNKALLSIMISNNFVELKGNVFKKFENANLFQMTCSDVRERFNYFVILSVVFLRNMTEFSWDINHFFQLFPDMALVLMCEIFVDWIKHAFITKFNDIHHEVYRDYTLYLAKDAVMRDNNNINLINNADGDKYDPNINKNIFTDSNSDLVCKQTGFTPLPLAVIFLKTAFQSMRASNVSFLSTKYHDLSKEFFYGLGINKQNVQPEIMSSI
ncbi:unnamed protein product [Gordionus sp. m RMFG-2023]